MVSYMDVDKLITLEIPERNRQVQRRLWKETKIGKEIKDIKINQKLIRLVNLQGIGGNATKEMVECKWGRKDGSGDAFGYSSDF